MARVVTVPTIQATAVVYSFRGEASNIIQATLFNCQRAEVGSPIKFTERG